MSTTEKLDALEVARAMTLAADMLERDLVLGERKHADQAEGFSIHVPTPDLVREFAARHDVVVQRPAGDDTYIYAVVGFGNGTKHDVGHEVDEAYRFAFTVQVTYIAGVES